MRRLCALCFVLLLLASPVASRAAGAAIPPAYLASLHWRLIGPFRGGRALAVTGVPGQPNHFYFGAVDGGVWESLDAGRTWNPIFDDQNIASIGSIAVAPSDPRTIYVGTGEADMRSDIAYGDGMYKSSDGGKSWSHIGLNDTKQIGAIVVDPHDPNVAYVAALGHPYAANADRGVFKTTDGGKSWTKVLYRGPDVGATALAMAPDDPNVLYAALWQTRRPPWNVYPPANGPGSGLYKSTDGGATWTHLTNGLPSQIGRIGLSISNAAPHRIYANVDSGPHDGGIYRSDDAGASWAHMDAEQRIWQRGWYFSGITADPRNADVVYVMNTSTYRSTDGGKSFDVLIGDPTGPDFHVLWIDPSDSNRMILGSDQGVIVTLNGARTWSSWYNQPTAQFYHVAVDNAFPFNVYGAQQDSGADMQTSQGRYGTISNQDFRPLDVGGESGTLAPDPRHPGVVYGNSSDGNSTAVREIPATGWERNLDPVIAHPDTLWRATWTLPIAFSPIDRTTLYVARQKIFRTRDGGRTWHVASPDLSRANEGTPANLDPTTLADNNGITRHGVVYTIAPSFRDVDVVWAGTDDGYIWVTRNGTRSWRNVTPPALTSWSKVGTIEASHFDAATAYAAVDRHRLDDYRPYIYRTDDYGASWKPITTGIPDGAFVNVVREDPTRPWLLYAGTERGIYVSFDTGGSWQPLQLNLPMTSIRDIAVHGDDLVVATHGRSFWVMDDISPLRQMRDAVACAQCDGSSGAYLFAPAAGYRVRPANQEGTPLPLDEPQVPNAPVGLYVDYYLNDVPRTPVVIEILSSNGTIVRSWSSAHPPKAVNSKSLSFLPLWVPAHPVPVAEAGAHRFVWDFHENSPDGPLVPPGTYTVRLRVNGKTYDREANVLRDPRIAASDADLRAEYELANQIVALRADVSAARAKAETRAKQLSGTAAADYRRDVVGIEPANNPDDSVGAYSHDLTSFLFLEDQLDYLESAVESADAAPTPDMRAAYAKLSAIYRQTLSRAAIP